VIIEKLANSKHLGNVDGCKASCNPAYNAA